MGTYHYKEEAAGISRMKSILIEIRKSGSGLSSSMDSAKEQTGELEDQTDAG